MYLIILIFLMASLNADSNISRYNDIIIRSRDWSRYLYEVKSPLINYFLKVDIMYFKKKLTSLKNPAMYE